jgi:hypothetical protein
MCPLHLQALFFLSTKWYNLHKILSKVLSYSESVFSLKIFGWSSIFNCFSVLIFSNLLVWLKTLHWETQKEDSYHRFIPNPPIFIEKCTVKMYLFCNLPLSFTTLPWCFILFLYNEVDFLLFCFCSTRIWTQGLTLARQAIKLFCQFQLSMFWCHSFSRLLKHAHNWSLWP